MTCSCDLLEIQYLCRCNNNLLISACIFRPVVICQKFSTFVGAITTWNLLVPMLQRCDLLEIQYLCRCNNNVSQVVYICYHVVICQKFSTFVGAITTRKRKMLAKSSCDLLEIQYLCRCNNNQLLKYIFIDFVVICQKFSTFVGAITTPRCDGCRVRLL